MLQRLAGGCFWKIVIISVISTIGVPFLFFFLRPDLDFSYYLGNDQPTEIDAKDFNQSITDNTFTTVKGTIDPEGSMFSAGFSTEQLVVKLKDYPSTFGVYVTDRRLVNAVRRDYNKFKDTLPDADQFIAAFSDRRSLTEFLSEDSPILQKQRTFSGRIYEDDEGKFERYSESKEIRKLTQRFDWLLVDKDAPSFSGLLGSNASIFMIIAGLATFIGLPAILMYAASKKTSKILAAAEHSPTPVGRNFESLPEFTKLSRIDAPKHWPRLTPRLEQFFSTEQGKLVRHEFAMPLWIRYIGVLLLFVGGLVLLPTIIFTKSAIKSLWSAFTLEPFRSNSNKETFERIRIIIVSVIFRSTPNAEGLCQAIALGTFTADKDFVFDDQTELAYRLSKIVRSGATTDAEQSLGEILDINGFFPHQRKEVPEEIAGRPGVYVFHVNLRPEQCESHLIGTYAACAADPHEKGEIYQIPWSVIEDLVQFDDE